MPKLKAEAWPPFGFGRYATREENFSTSSGVRSVEPSSTTRISQSDAGKSCSSTLAIACSMNFSWLYVSISTLTNGFAKFQPFESVGDQQRKEVLFHFTACKRRRLVFRRFSPHTEKSTDR